MLIYGLYQRCSEDNSSNNISQEADVCRRSVEWVDSKKMDVNDAIIKYYSNLENDYLENDPLEMPDHLNWNMSDIEYKSVQICSTADLTFAVIKFLLSQENFIKLRFGRRADNMWNGREIYVEPEITNYEDTRILAILIYADDTLSSTAVQLLANSKFPIYHLKSGWEPPKVDNLHLKNRKNVFSEAPNFFRVNELIKAVLSRKKTQYFTMLHFKGRNFLHEEKYQKFRTFLEQQSEFCFDVYEVRENEEFNATIGTIKSNKRTKVVMTFGDGKKQLLFFNEAISQGVHNLSWIFQDANIVNAYFPFDLPKTTEIAYIRNCFALYDYINDLKFFTMPNETISAIVDNYRETRFVCKMKMVSLINAFISGLWKLIYRRTRYAWYELFQRKFRDFVRKIYEGRPYIKTILIKENRGQVGFSFLFRRVIRNTTCIIPTCQRGDQLRSTYNDSSYGPNCVLCSKNYYKNEIGNRL